MYIYIYIYKWHVCPGSYNWKKDKRGERKWENVGRGCFKRAGEEGWKEVEAWMGWEVAKEGR